jgi:hypothetical protein
MSTKSREYLFGSTIRASAERAKAARKDADEYACIAWNNRMLGYKGPAQPSPSIGDALNAGFGYLEVRCLCGAGIARRFDAIRINVAIWWRCGRRRFRHLIRHQRGGQEKGEHSL